MVAILDYGVGNFENIPPVIKELFLFIKFSLKIFVTSINLKLLSLFLSLIQQS